MKLLISLTLFFNISYSIEAPIETDIGCEESNNVGILFLNGVQNDAQQALVNLKSTRNIYDLKSGNKKNVCYKLLYNQDDGYVDFVEVIAQKVREKFPDLQEDDLWSAIGNFLFLGNLVGKNLDESYLTQKEIQEIYELSLIENNRIQNAELKTLNEITRKTKDVLADLPVVVVSHSQGNLFANRLYEEIELDTFFSDRLDSYANLQVASPANIIQSTENGISFGDYMTSKQDFIIAPIDNTPFGILDPNLEIRDEARTYIDGTRIQTSGDKFYDIVGHSFSDVYVNSRVFALLDNETNFVPISDIFFDKISRLIRNVKQGFFKPSNQTEKISSTDGSVRLGNTLVVDKDEYTLLSDRSTDEYFLKIIKRSNTDEFNIFDLNLNSRYNGLRKDKNGNILLLEYDPMQDIQYFVLYEFKNINGQEKLVEKHKIELPSTLVALRSSVSIDANVNLDENKYYFYTLLREDPNDFQSSNINAEVEIDINNLEDTNSMNDIKVTLLEANDEIPKELNINSEGSFIGLKRINNIFSLFIKPLNGNEIISKPVSGNFLATQATVDNDKNIYFKGNLNETNSLEAYDSLNGDFLYIVEDFPTDIFNLTSDNRGNLYGIQNGDIVRLINEKELTNFNPIN